MKKFNIEELKKAPQRVLMIQHYQPETPILWLVPKPGVMVDDRVAIRMPETGYVTDDVILVDACGEIRDCDGNMVGTLCFAESSDNARVSIEELGKMVEQLPIGGAIDFTCDEDSDHWGIQKLRLFDGEIIAIGSYGGGMTTMLDRQFSSEAEELYAFIKDSLHDHTPDCVYMKAPTHYNQPHYSENMTKCVAKLKGCTNYNDADRILKEHGLSLSIYGHYESPVAYATYALSMDKEEPRYITLYYEFKKVGHDSYAADKIIKIEIRE